MELERDKITALVKGFTLPVNPEMHKHLYPEDWEPKAEQAQDQSKYIVPTSEKELEQMFDDLKSLGINVGNEPNAQAQARSEPVPQNTDGSLDIDSLLREALDNKPEQPKGGRIQVFEG